MVFKALPLWVDQGKSNVLRVLDLTTGAKAYFGQWIESRKWGQRRWIEPNYPLTYLGSIASSELIVFTLNV